LRCIGCGVVQVYEVCIYLGISIASAKNIHMAIWIVIFVFFLLNEGCVKVYNLVDMENETLLCWCGWKECFVDLVDNIWASKICSII
jgi:hypothetical protein